MVPNNVLFLLCKLFDEILTSFLIQINGLNICIRCNSVLTNHKYYLIKSHLSTQIKST